MENLSNADSNHPITVMEFSIIFCTLPLAKLKCEWKCVTIWAISSDRTMQIQKLWISNYMFLYDDYIPYNHIVS